MSLTFFFNKNLPHGNINHCLDFLNSHGHLEVLAIYMAFRHSRCNIYLLKKIYNTRQGPSLNSHDHLDQL